MSDRKINLKLINISLLAFIVAIVFFTYPFWGGLLAKLFAILAPFIISFAIAYALYPFLKKMQKKGIPKILSYLSFLF